MDFLRYNEAVLERSIAGADLDTAENLETAIDKRRNKLRKTSRKSIEQDSRIDVRGELIFMDIIRHLEHIGDNSLNISQAIGDLV
jgi:phosphate:Na+ symporter